MARKGDKPLVNILMSEEDLLELDEWQHDNRFATRAEAMRFLMKMGIRTKPKVSKEERQALSA